jgi:hypothetical protein
MNQIVLELVLVLVLDFAFQGRQILPDSPRVRGDSQNRGRGRVRFRFDLSFIIRP